MSKKERMIVQHSTDEVKKARGLSDTNETAKRGAAKQMQKKNHYTKKSVALEHLDKVTTAMANDKYLEFSSVEEAKEYLQRWL